jgi:hypothetical protein
MTEQPAVLPLMEEVLKRLLKDEGYRAELQSAGGLVIEVSGDGRWGILLPRQEMIVRLEGGTGAGTVGAPVLSGSVAALQSMLDGSGNLQAAVLKGEISLAGEPELLQGLWRLTT